MAMAPTSEPRTITPVISQHSLPTPGCLNNDPESSASAIVKTLLANSTVAGVAQRSSCLQESVIQASLPERSFALRVALITSTVKQIHSEVRGWQWPDNGNATSWSGKSNLVSKHGAIRQALAADQSPERSHLGCLPLQLFLAYEARLKVVRNEIEDLPVQELKEHVLDTHVPSEIQSLSATELDSPHQAGHKYKHLDDLTAITTATILQVLPSLEKLRVLLNTWDSRIRVVRKTEPFLAALAKTQTDLRAAWSKIQDITPLGDGRWSGNVQRPSTESPNKDSCHVSYDFRCNNTITPALDTWNTRLTHADLKQLRTGLRDQVASVGRHIDLMLDDLEGQPEQLPELWLDAVERVEADYAEWELQAEKALLELNLSTIPATSQLAQLGDNPPEMRNVDRQENFCNTASHNEPSTRNAADPIIESGPFEQRTQSWLGLPETENVLSSITNDGTLSSGSGVVTSDYNCEGYSTDGEVTMPALSARRASAKFIEIVHEGDIKQIEVRKRERGLAESPPQHNEAKDRLRRTSVPSPGMFLAIDTPVPSEPSSVLYMTDDEPSPSIRTAKKHSGMANSSKRTMIPVRVKKRPSTATTTSKASLVSPNDSDYPQDHGNGATRKPKQISNVVSDSPSVDVRAVDGSTEARSCLEAQITAILGTVPAKIHLAQSVIDDDTVSGPEWQPDGVAQSPRVSRKADERSETPAIVLAPVHQDTFTGPRLSNKDGSGRSRRSTSTQWYHLGRAVSAGGFVEPPIKLFVRQVGADGERVMVRVGGGWADLGEYLREYASHHSSGRRAVSDGRFQICDLTTPKSTRSRSGRATPNSGTSYSSPDNVRSMANGDFRCKHDMAKASSMPPVGGASPGSAEASPSVDTSSSAASSRLSWVEHGVEFGQLGKVGGTKRVFRKSGGI